MLHLFPYYLAPTEIWLFNLIRHIPDARGVVASKHFFLGGYYSRELEYLEFPVKKVINRSGDWRIRGLNAMIAPLLALYPGYVRRACGGCQLMHSHYGPTAWEYRRLGAQMGVPWVVSFYGFDYRLPSRHSVWRKRYRAVFEMADLCLTEGPHGARVLVEQGCSARKVRVSRLGVDVGNIAFCRRRKSPGELTLLQVASFVEKKGHADTLAAFRMALEDCPGMSLTLVGSRAGGGVRAATNEAVRRDRRLMQSVVFVESIAASELHSFMAGYQAFIHPSREAVDGDCEGGAPIVLLDAQATGLPVISTTHCDIPEEVLDGQSGLLVRERDTEALAESIRTFYRMGQREYDAFSKAGRVHVEKLYDIRLNAAGLRSEYQELLVRRMRPTE